MHRRDDLQRIPADLREGSRACRGGSRRSTCPEPSIAETIEILKGLKTRFEQHHGVKYAPAALTTAAELAARFINDRHLPDKAIDVIDEAGAAQKILPKSRQKKVISKTEIEEIVAKIARIPAEERHVRRPQRAEDARPRPEERRVRPEPGDRCAGRRDPDGALGPRQPAQADRQLPVQRTDGRGQDRGRAPARVLPAASS